MAEHREKSDYSALKRPPYRSLTDIAYGVLLEAIINQDFQPGAQIGIDSLARQLNMSNTPVREALMRVHGEGLVTQKTNHGFVVSEILTADECRQLFEVRHLLEVHAVSIGKSTPDFVGKIAELVDRMRATGGGTVYHDYHEFMTLDHQFHQTLVGSAHNPFLLDSWESLHVHLHLSRLYTGIGLFDREDTTKEHQAIVEVLQKGDSHAAANLLGHHIQRVGQSMQSFLQQK